MAIGFILEFPGVTQQHYDEVGVAIGLDGGPAEGALAHFAGPMEGGWRVVDLWESQAAFEAFFQSRLGPALQNLNLPKPNVTVAEVYNHVIAPVG